VLRETPSGSVKLRQGLGNYGRLRDTPVGSVFESESMELVGFLARVDVRRKS
jgi:hypothetical protein